MDLQLVFSEASLTVCDYFLSLNSLSQLYVKIFMPALPVSDTLNILNVFTITMIN